MATVELTTDNFESTIKDNPFVVVDFWATWCGPCRSFAPIYEKVSEDHPDMIFGKVNTEEQQELAAHFQIRSIPTVMILRESVIIFSQPGTMPEGSFRELLQKASELDMEKVHAEVSQQQGADSA
jgi:thioredoxin 1